MGPNWTLTPLPLNSWPMETPRWYIRVLLNLYNSDERRRALGFDGGIRCRCINATVQPKLTSWRIMRRWSNTHAGKAELRSTFRTPSALSCRHNPEKLIFEMGRILPVQLPSLEIKLHSKIKEIRPTSKKSLACGKACLLLETQIYNCSFSLRWKNELY